MIDKNVNVNGRERKLQGVVKKFVWQLVSKEKRKKE
jgi:hypothetical protein